MPSLNQSDPRNRDSLDVSVIIVSYNTCEMTLTCIDSVFRETQQHSLETIVVDNASNDDSAQAIGKKFPLVRLIASKENLGFAAGNNLAARGAQGKYLLLLNPDTVVLNGAIDRLVDFAERHPEGGIFGGRTLFGDGSLNPTSCWRVPSAWGLTCRALGISGLARNSPLFNYDSYGGWARDTMQPVGIVSGCFLLIRRDLWNALGGFDESFFMYGEDWDLCLRARKLGTECLLCPAAEIIHYGGASETVRADKIVRLFRSQSLLFHKHWGRVQAALLVALLHLWAIRACLTGSVSRYLGRSGASDGGRVWLEVLRRRGEWRGQGET